VFEKYQIALTNPRESPLAPLEKGGTGLLVPLFKGDLGGFKSAIVANKTFQTPSQVLREKGQMKIRSCLLECQWRSK
jgi:hypothetical protein